MKVAVRYFSQFGRTKAIAEEIADEVGVEAISIDDEPILSERCDVLFLGGAPYVNVMAAELEGYARRLDPDKVGKAVLFTTSNWSRRTVIALRKILEEKGIAVAPDHFYAHMSQIESRKPASRAFASRQMAAAAAKHSGTDVPAIVSETIASVIIVAGALALTVFAAKRIARSK